jgi:glycosyltransferase involved in cell wall biosynthesis
VRELVRQGVAVELTDLPQWGPTKLPDAMRDPWFETLDKPVDAQIVLHFCMPHQITCVPDRINVNYTMFEADRICRLWVDLNNLHELDIVPTESSRQAWIRSGVPQKRVRLCPLGVDPHRFSGSAVPLPQLADIQGYRHRFLNIAELGPRKNHLGLVRAWLRATSRGDDAILILKRGSYAPGWRGLFERHIAVAQDLLGKSLDQAAPIRFVDDIFSDDEMPGLYASATHYISMSLGEGWDQTMVEAAAAGLTLIAPDHSAYTAYLARSSAHLLPVHEIPAIIPGDPGLRMLFANARWWEPDENAAVSLIRSIVAGTAPTKTSPRCRIVRDLTWENATRRLITLLSEAEAGTTRRFWRLPRAYKRA